MIYTLLWEKISIGGANDNNIDRASFIVYIQD